jgi:dCMP deaminase
MRIGKDEYYLKIAETVAIRSTCIRRKYGAVIVSNDEIVATGYNGSPRGEPNCCDTGDCYRNRHARPADRRAAVHGGQYGICVAVHAEQNAIISAARKELQGAVLYLACLSEDADPAPCNCCDRMIKNAGITKVVTKGDLIWACPR